MCCVAHWHALSLKNICEPQVPLAREDSTKFMLMITITFTFTFVLSHRSQPASVDSDMFMLIFTFTFTFTIMFVPQSPPGSMDFTTFMFMLTFMLTFVPQVPPASIDFTTFTWNAMLKRLKQMQITGKQTGTLMNCNVGQPRQQTEQVVLHPTYVPADTHSMLNVSRTDSAHLNHPPNHPSQSPTLSPT